MPKALVIVESPAKAKTINKYLGKDYVVKASLGHIKDLPKRDLAVDVDHDFEPRYEVIEGKKKLIARTRPARAHRRLAVPVYAARRGAPPSRRHAGQGFRVAAPTDRAQSRPAGGEAVPLEPAEIGRAHV